MSSSPVQLKRATPSEIATLTTLKAPEALKQALLHNPSAFESGFTIIAPFPLAGFANNLAYKFMEGLYWRCPQVVELISFAHGPFQQLVLRPQPVIILQSSAPRESDIVDRCVGMLRGVGLASIVVRVDAQPDLAVIGFETIFNEVREHASAAASTMPVSCPFAQVILDLMRELRVDQINFPGKHADGPLCE